MNVSRTVQKIQSQIDQEQKLMFIHEKNGNYADAEKSRLKMEQLHKDHETRSIYELNVRHKNEIKALSENNYQQLVAFNGFWSKREEQINQQEEKMEAQMLQRHKTQIAQTRKELQMSLSPKVKESSELLNLRRMEQHMVKQKNYAQAHKIQQQIADMQKTEKGFWLQKRDERIQVALTTLKAKQNVQLINLKKRYKTLLDQVIVERKRQQSRLLLKHNNLTNDLKSQQQKELLNSKGQFKSKGGKESPMRTRSSFHS